MKPDFDTILDECIRRIETGEALSVVLADYPDFSAKLEPLLSLAQAMYELPTPEESTAAAAVGQARMLEKFDTTYAGQTKTPFWQSWPLLLTQFSQSITSIFSKETMMYRKSFIAIALVLVVLFAGTTMTAYAAQGSLPGDLLYSLKTTFEDMSLNATWDTTGEAEKSIQYADRRIQEITELISRSRYEDVPMGVERFEYHLREALTALSVVAQNDPELARELASILVSLLDEQSQLLVAILKTNPGIDQVALQDALTASLASIGTANSVTGLDDNVNDNGDDNANDNGNDNDDDDANDNDDDGANENDDDGANENDDDGANENDDDGANENDDDDANENDDDGANENDDDDANENDDDDANENDDDDANENDDDGANENDDDGANENDDDDGNDNDDDGANENDDDDANENDDDGANENDDDDGNDNDDDGANENDDDDANENDDDDGNENDDDDGNENDDDDDDANENDDDGNENDDDDDDANENDDDGNENDDDDDDANENDDDGNENG